MNFKIKISDFVFIFIGIIIVILSLYPYWIYGSFSALGWYDEFNQQIPWWYNQSKLNNPNGFLYGYAGGLGGLVGKGSQYISGQQIVVNFSPLWISLLIYRILSLFLTFLGFYIFSRFIIKISSFKSLLLSLIPLYVSIEIYSTTLAGVGWQYAGVIWFAVISIMKFKNNIYDVIFITFYIFLTSANATPFFLLPSIFVFYIFLRISFDSKYFLDKRAFVIFIILAICMLINSLPNFITLFEVKNYSARLTKVLTNFNEVNNLNFFDYLTIKILSSYKLLKINFLRNHHEVMFCSYFLIIFLLLIYKKYSFLIKIIFFPFILYPVLDIGAGILDLPVISTYRWDILVSMLSCFIAISFMYLDKNQYLDINQKIITRNKVINFTLSLFIVVSLVISINYLTKSTMYQLNYGGGLGIIKEYQGLNKFNYTKNKYRFISGDYETLPSLPTYYNLDTFDGAATHFPKRRNYYIAYAMFNKPKKYLHTHYHTFVNLPNNHNMKAFKRANIKFINYSKPLEKTNFILESKFIGKKIEKSSVVNPLYIYSLGKVTPRIFLAEKLATSQHSYTDQKFYLELNMLGLRDALVAEDDANDYYNTTFIKDLEIDKKVFSENRVIINFKNFGDGFLIFNQVYTHHWSAKCDDKNIDIIPVNGIMMGIILNKVKCKKIEFKYN